MKSSLAILLTLATGFGSTVAVDSPTKPHDRVLEGTSALRSPETNALFTFKAWVVLLDDFQADPCNACYIPGMSGEVPEAPGLYDSSLSGDFSEARRVLGKVAIYRYAGTPAQVAGRPQAGTGFETSTLTLLGLVLMVVGLLPRSWHVPPKFRACDAVLSRARIFRLAAVKLRKRSEAELNSFSARYATIEVQEEDPLAGRQAPAAFPHP